MGLTLLDARTLVLSRYLNDPSARRTSAAEVNEALEGQLSAALSRYAGDGGDFLRRSVEATTTSDGELDLSSYGPIRIDAVSERSGDAWIPAFQEYEGNSFGRSRAAVPLLVVLSGTPTFPATDGDPLVDHASTFLDFERYVCLMTAIELGAADGDAKKLRELEGRAERYWQSVRRRRMPSHGFSPAMPGSFVGRRGWIYRPDTQKLYLTVGQRRF